jgi:DNA-binding NarL/FixJ family response regulator
MVLVPLVPEEATQLLSGAPVEHEIPAGQVPLVDLVARGLGASEVARELGVSPRTVQRHVARLSQDFGVATIQQLATELARRGFGVETSRIGLSLSQDDVSGNRMDVSGNE